MTLMGGGAGGVWGGVVELAVCGEGPLLKLSHEGVRDRGAGGAAHGASVRLGVIYALPLKMGETEDLLLEGNDVVDGHVVAALWECGVLLE